MLRTLSIKNIAVIENVNIDFEGGFNILTGETGAGKSIIIDSINLLKGERASKDIIRNGEAKARVDAVFDVDSKTAEELSEILGVDISDEIMLTRELSVEGKSTCRIDGTPVTLAMLSLAGERLVDIHGQHDNTSLLAKKTHLGFLDKYGSADIAPVLEEYRSLHAEYGAVADEIESIDVDEKERERRAELLRYQIEEIEMSGIFEGEDTELEERKTVLKNSYKIASATTKAYENLYGGDSGEKSAYDALWTAIKAIEPIADLDKSLSEAYSALSDASDVISENARFLKNYCEDVESTSGELDKIEERLEEIDDLKHKFAPTIEKILQKKEDMQAELDSLVFGEERISELKLKLEKLGKQREKTAENLSSIRKKYAQSLSQAVESELKGLCMPGVRFETAFKDCPCRSDGTDDIEFVICTNAGEGLKPLGKIASGGELSRIMLAIKSVLADCESEKLLIFDEVDAGVSGRAAQSIGEKLWKTSRYSQVICITHLPQIAAMADSHYLIEKHSDGDRTRTEVNLITEDKRIAEIARTLGGADITEAALTNARELVGLADKFKGEK